MVFEQLAQAVLSFVNWGITIVVIMLIWEIIQFIRGGSEDRGTGSSGIGKKSLGEIKEGFNKWTGREEVEKKKKISRAASREETKLLNDIIVEKKEMELIEAALKEGNAYHSGIEAIDKGKLLTKAVFNSSQEKFKSLQSAFEDVIKVQKSWKKAERREVAQLKRLLAKMRSIGVDDRVLNDLSSREKIILNNYIVVTQLITKAEQNFNLLKKGQSRLEKSVGKASSVLNDALSAIDVATKDFMRNLVEAKETEEKAFQNTTSFIDQIHKKWTM